MLTLEWGRRIKSWRKELAQHFYRPLGALDLSGFITLEHLTGEQAQQGDFRPMPAGTAWGAKWEYGWFRGEVVLPEEAAGRRIALRLEPGGESLIYVDGRAAGARDRYHREITLSTAGVPGTRYAVLAESYAGHGPMVVTGGPIPLDRESVPEPPPAQRVVGASSFGIWEEEVYQLWVDVETLAETRESLDQFALRVAEIDQGLRDFTTIVDFELPHEEMLATVRACRQRLKPLLACVNGSTSPLLYAFGHAHIDVAWLWPLQETERKGARTFSTALALMEEYPDYRFLASTPHVYQMMKEQYPDIYQRIKEAVQRGQFLPEGGMWVESDTNVPSGESLIRQFLYGKRFFREEFGVDSELLWLPDVFGYSGAMPQIMRGCGIKYFSTAKIFWAYNGGEQFPYNTFMWEGIDGSQVLAHFCNDYNSHTNPAMVVDRWKGRVQLDGIATRLFPFGYGDGGGGPTRDHLEYLRRERDLEGLPRVKPASPIDYFKDQEARGLPANRYVGELYFQAHRGTLTSQAKTKRGNRKSELALREAELWGTAAAALQGFQFPRPEVERAWTGVLLNQFHDIIPGSSIARVYQEAEALYAETLRAAGDISVAATAQLTDGGEGLSVFNSLSWPRSALVPLPEGSQAASDDDGAALPVQQIDGRAHAEVTLPPCGWTALRPHREAVAASTGGARAGERTLENDLLRVELNERGEVVSIRDKEADRELAAEPCNSFRLYKDVPTMWDAWDIDSMYNLTPVALDEPAELEVVAEGPLLAAIRVRRKLHDSELTQEISLRRGSRRLDFATTLDWRERHKLLKVNFPVAIRAAEALHEIQFGYLARPTHQSRPFDADRFEVAQQRWTALVEENRGAALLNDCKYGVNVADNSINLTLLKAALAPDMRADLGRHTFTYAFYAWNGPLTESGLVQAAYELNCPPLTAPGTAPETSLFNVDAPNVILDTVKPAEDGSGAVIVRLYEAMRATTRCTLHTALPVDAAVPTDMLERPCGGALPLAGGALSLDFRPFEVKTLRLALRPTQESATQGRRPAG